MVLESRVTYFISYKQFARHLTDVMQYFRSSKSHSGVDRPMSKRCIYVILSCLGIVPLAHGQSIFDAPAQCAVTLQKDVYSNVKTTDQDFAYASLVDEHTYDEIKHDASAGATIPVTAGLVNGTANYSDY